MSDLIQRGDVFKALWARNIHEGMGLDALITMEDALGAVVSIPAVDAVPVVHARWIDHKDEHQCFGCREITIVDFYVWKNMPFDYCPNCGAKMDGGEKDA